MARLRSEADKAAERTFLQSYKGSEAGYDKSLAAHLKQFRDDAAKKEAAATTQTFTTGPAFDPNTYWLAHPIEHAARKQKNADAYLGLRADLKFNAEGMRDDKGDETGYTKGVRLIEEAADLVKDSTSEGAAQVRKAIATLLEEKYTKYTKGIVSDTPKACAMIANDDDLTKLAPRVCREFANSTTAASLAKIKDAVRVGSAGELAGEALIAPEVGVGSGRSHDRRSPG